MLLAYYAIPRTQITRRNESGQLPPDAVHNDLFTPPRLPTSDFGEKVGTRFVVPTSRRATNANPKPQAAHLSPMREPGQRITQRRVLELKRSSCNGLSFAGRPVHERVLASCPTTRQHPSQQELAMKNWKLAFVSPLVAWLSLNVSAVGATTLTQRLGDSDFFGFEVGTIGSPVPRFDFNNTAGADPSFTDHDIRKSTFGADADNNVSWTHDLSVQLSSMTLISAALELPLGGIQDGQVTFGAFDDRLFIEGTEVLGAFDAIDQGPFGTSLFSFLLSPIQLASFQTDGKLTIAIDGGKIPPGLGINSGALESYFIDYSRVVLEAQTTSVAEPGSLCLLLFGLGGFLVFRSNR
jgi:hypothetical protein